MPHNLAEKFRAHAKNTESMTRIKAMVVLAESEEAVVVLPDIFDKNKVLFNVWDGTIDLTTGELKPHRREDYITLISPVRFKQTSNEAEHSLWIEFINTIMNHDPDLISYLQKIAGQLLCGEVREKALYILHGKKDTGKTTFVETLAYVCSDYAETLAIESLMKRARGAIPNDIAALKGKRFVFVDEPDFGDRISEGLIKKLTGLDTINARFLNQEFFKFKPEFKLYISTNNAPDITDRDQAVWGRIKKVPFLTRIPPDKQDKTLQAKLCSDMESSIVLRWMVQGCVRWLKEGLIEPKIVRDMSEAYREDMDTLGDFFKTCCVTGYDYTVPHEHLYTAFCLWSKAIERRPLSSKFFTQICDNRDIERGRYYQDDRRVRGYFGLKLTDWMTTAVGRYVYQTDEEANIIKDIIIHLFENQQNEDSIKNNLYNPDTNPNIPVPPVPPVPSVPMGQVRDRCHVRFSDIGRHNGTDGTDGPAFSGSILYREGCVHEKDIRPICPTCPTTTDIAISTSVPSVPSVPNKSNIQSMVLTELHYFDKYNKQDMLSVYKNMDEVKQAIELKILTEFPELNEFDIMRYIEDYFRVRQW
jgi:P4 family phage/plasmid primase-like protien